MSSASKNALATLSKTLLTTFACLSIVASPVTAQAAQPKGSKTNKHGQATGTTKKATKKKPEPAPPEAEPEPEAKTEPKTEKVDKTDKTEKTEGKRDATDAKSETSSNKGDAKPVSIAGLLGYGSGGLHFGTGARGGYTLPMNVYLGGTIMYHFGQHQDVPDADGGTTSVGASMLYLGAEGGYDFHAGPWLIRPYGGLGPAVVIVSGPGSTSETNVGFWLGGTGQYLIPNSPAMIGADMRLLLSTGGGDASVGFFATGGARF